MASSRSKAPLLREPARLYLITPPVADDVATLAGEIVDACADADVAAVMLRLEAADERGMIKRIKTVAEAVQPLGVALIVEGHPDLVARGGADGAHLSGIEALNAALPGLRPQRIAGCGGLQTRHDAMLAAEAGADYVLFGEPDAHDVRPSPQAVAERVAWWADVFQTPCVGYAGAPDEIAALAATRTEFIALGAPFFALPGGIAQAARDAAAHLATAEPVS